MKNTRYLKYAIGEIFLVMVGILLALAINNWNEQRLKSNLAREYLVSLIEDLVNDTLSFDLSIDYYGEDIEKNRKVLEDPGYKNLHLDSIFSLVFNTYNTNTTTDQTYQKIKNSGLSELLGSTALENAINHYYSNVITRYKTFIDFDEKYTQQDFEFWVLNDSYEARLPDTYTVEQLSGLPFMDPEQERKAALIQRVESAIGRNHIRAAILRKGMGIKRSMDSKKEAKDLINLITRELNNHP